MRARWVAGGALVLIAVLGLVLGLLSRGASPPASAGPADGTPPPSGVAAGAPCGPLMGATDTAADGAQLVCWIEPNGTLRWRPR
jgi:hypothetical protein